MTIDLGLTHIALPVTDIDCSIQFYAVYAQMQVIHRRIDSENRLRKIHCNGGRSKDTALPAVMRYTFLSLNCSLTNFQGLNCTF
jgi:hypothetical protein